MNIREKIDPHNTLPQVELRPAAIEDVERVANTYRDAEEYKDREPFQIIYEEDGEKRVVGGAVLKRMGDTAVAFANVKLDPRYQGKGIGTSAYLEPSK